jgi:hypothetical protein
MQDFATLTEDEAMDAAVALLEQLSDARLIEESAHRRVVGIRRILDGLVEMFPALEDLLPEDLDEDEPPRPRGAQAALRALGEVPGTWFTVPMIVSNLSVRGWEPASSNPANAVRTALERLVKTGAIEKGRSTQSEVIYRQPPPPAAEAVTDDDFDPELYEETFGEPPF